MEAFGTDHVMVLLFDELRTEPQRFVNRVCAFIGISPIDLRTVRVCARDVNADHRMPRSDALARLGSRLLEYMYRHSLYSGIALIERTALYSSLFGGGDPYPPLPLELDLRIRAGMIPEITAVEALTGFDLSPWKVSRPAGSAVAVPDVVSQPLPNPSKAIA